MEFLGEGMSTLRLLWLNTNWEAGQWLTSYQFDQSQIMSNNWALVRPDDQYFRAYIVLYITVIMFWDIKAIVIKYILSVF